MRIYAVVFCLLVSASMPGNQAQPPREVTVAAAIEEHFTKVSGVTLHFPADWEVLHYEDDHYNSVLYLRSGSDRMTLVESALEPREKLQQVFDISLKGVLDGAAADAVGKQTIVNVDGCEIITQRLHKKSEIGELFGVYRGFFSHNFYVRILHWGLENTFEGREAIVTTLHIQKVSLATEKKAQQSVN